jgi:Family of unknown function (DUF6064)
MLVSNSLPFTREQFINVFADYNNAMWPMQVFAYLLGVIMVVALVRARRVTSNKTNYLIGFGLALMWVWAGVAYHGLFFSTINTAAFFFAALFVLQALLLMYFTIRRRLKFASASGISRWIGWALIVYALLVYPLAGILNGHHYPEMPMFGITPCPVTIFTVGLFVLTQPPLPRALLVIPFLWSLLGGSAVFVLGVAQDWPLLFCLFAIPFIVIRDRKFSSSKPNRAMTSV